MFEPEEQVENIVFQALAHPMRRTILKIIAYRPEGVSYTDLITELGLSTGKLNYHLEQLEGLVGKNEKRYYVPTSLGKKALNQLNLIKEELSSEDEKYVRIAEASQKSSLQPVLRSFLLVGIAFSSLILLGWIFLAYVAITEGAPVIVYILLPVLFAIGVGLLSSLILALKKTPDWVKRLERRLLGPA
jgi:DNA-binding transcriptional ArsR family regulator